MHQNPISSQGIAFRRDLEHIHGKKVHFICMNCANSNKVGVNKVFAIESKTLLFVCGFLGFCVIIGGLITQSKSEWSIYYTTLIGGMIISSGFYCTRNSNSRLFNKTFIQ